MNKNLKIKDLNRTVLDWDLSYGENPFLYVMCKQIVEGWEVSTSTNIVKKELLSFVNMTEEDLIVDVADNLLKKLNKGNEFYGEVMKFYEREVLEFPLEKRRFSDKFKLLETETIEYEGRTLHRIQCTQEFEHKGLTIYKGQRGGFVENIDNIVDGWVFGCAKAFDNSKVYGLLKGNSVTKNNSIIDKDAIIDGDCIIKDNATVNGNLCGKIIVKDSSIIEEPVIIKTYGIGSINISGKTYMKASCENPLEISNNNHTKTQIINTIVDGDFIICNVTKIINSELYYGCGSEIINHNIYNSQIYIDGCKSSFVYGGTTKDDCIVKDSEGERSLKETKFGDAEIRDIILTMSDLLVDKENIIWRC